MLEAIWRVPSLYRLQLRWRGARRRPARPDAPWMNGALRTKAEAGAAEKQVRRLGLHPHPDAPKNWDALAALDFILQRTSTSARVLDAGGETYSPLVEWLFLYGYHDLDVLNLSFAKPFRRGPIRYTPGDCTRSPYPDASFDVVTCLSVLEHGVDVDAFLRDASRILKPGGHLIVSTDYWSTPISTRGLQAYGNPVRVFTPPDVKAWIGRAGTLGLEPTGAIGYETRERAVRWDRFGLDYTFIVFALRRA